MYVSAFCAAVYGSFFTKPVSRPGVAATGAPPGWLSSCELLEFSPNDHRAPESQRDLTAKNLARLAAAPLPADDTLRFVFTGDSQRFYDDVEALVKSVNQQPGIQFMVVSGDISDFGLAREMRWVDDQLRQLKVPYLTVIGNHDHVANGRDAYQEIFGPLNYSFVYGDTKFILADTNGREYNFNGRIPDMDWVTPQLRATDSPPPRGALARTAPGCGLRPGRARRLRTKPCAKTRAWCSR